MNATLEALPAMQESVRAGKAMVVGDVYAVHDGTVEWLETKTP